MGGLGTRTAIRETGGREKLRTPSASPWPFRASMTPGFC